MVNLKNISIRSKLVIIQVFTSILVLGVFFTIFIITDINSYKQRTIAGTLSVAQVVAVNSVPTLLFQDNEAAGNILSELHNVSPEIIYAAIIDQSGKLFAQYKDSLIPSLRFSPGMLAQKSLFTADGLFVSNDIKSDNATIGKVIIGINLVNMKEMIQFKYRLAIILLICAVAFSFLLAITIQTYISKRLLYLVDTMKHVSDYGTYKTLVTDNGKDEISVLFRAFNSLMLQIEETQQKKDEFISIASHELKTPLTSIKGYVQLLERFDNNDKNRMLIQKALSNINKLERLIKDLLDVSKIQTGQMQLNMHEFNIEELIQETVCYINETFVGYQIIREDSFNGQTIVADRHRIEQVLLNLLSNAVKYSQNERKILVCSKKTNSEIVVQVRDFGVGIPEKEKDKIFERFYRTTNVESTVSGFGLGLYICKSIITRHGGKIWVVPEEIGSSFYFSLPLNFT